MSAGLPTGTVTFLFTDIEGSTKRWEAHPDTMRTALARHDAILRATIETQGGHVFKTVGDAFCAAFADPTNALNAAIVAQQNLHSADWEGNGVLVRMGLHTGVVEAQGGDYYGQPLNRVARLMAAGHGGQALLSQPTYELVRDHLPTGVQLRDMGEHRLRDLIRPEHVYQVVIHGLPADFPPLKTLDYRPNNLPAQPTALIGREKESADIGKLLEREDVRLVTLTGPGGIGKTRLALQAAADLLDDYVDGVWFVNLAPVTDPGLVVSTIAQTLDVKEVGGQPLLDTLKSYLREKHVLLVVDNFEQVISAATSISDLLATCPRMKVLVTSRIALRLRGEREYSVPALDMPDPKQMPALDTLTQYEAVRLFIERAQGVKADFEVTNDNAPAVAEICVRLDGLPLAIELAAARVKTLPPQAMLARLENRLKMLTGGARDLPVRQQTILKTIEWSYDLLDEGEKQLFRRMAVFQGGRTLEGLDAVCNSEALQVEGQLQMDLLDGLDSLISKSLVGQRQGRNGEPRYWMLETIHEFARLKLEESGEGEALARQHALYFMQMADRAEHEIIGPDQVEWLDMLEDEHDNIRAVLAWVRKKSQIEVAGEDEEPHPVDIGLRMVRTLHRFWVYRSYYTEGRMQINSIRNLEAANDGSRARQAARAWAMVSETISAHRQDDTKLSAELSAAALDLFRELGDKSGIATAILPLALKPSSDPEYVRTLLNESKALFEELGDKWNLGRAYFYLGQHEHFVGNIDLSFELYSKGLALMQETGDKSSIAHTYVQLGHVTSHQAKYADAQTYFENGLALYRQVRDRWGTVVGLLNVMHIPWRQGMPDPLAMRQLAEEALDLSKQLGTGGLIGQACQALGRLALLEGSVGKARGFLEEGLGEVRRSNRAYYEAEETELIRYLGHVARIEGDVDKARALYEETLLPRYFEEANTYWRNLIPANTLPALASLEAGVSSPRRIARLLGASEAFFEAGGELMTYYERALYEASFELARARMGDEAAWQAAWNEGKAMTVEQAIAYALEGNDG